MSRSAFIKSFQFREVEFRKRPDWDGPSASDATPHRPTHPSLPSATRPTMPLRPIPQERFYGKSFHPRIRPDNSSHNFTLLPPVEIEITMALNFLGSEAVWDDAALGGLDWGGLGPTGIAMHAARDGYKAAKARLAAGERRARVAQPGQRRLCRDEAQTGGAEDPRGQGEATQRGLGAKKEVRTGGNVGLEIGVSGVAGARTSDRRWEEVEATSSYGHHKARPQQTARRIPVSSTIDETPATVNVTTSASPHSPIIRRTASRRTRRIQSTPPSSRRLTPDSPTSPPARPRLLNFDTGRVTTRPSILIPSRPRGPVVIDITTSPSPIAVRPSAPARLSHNPIIVDLTSPSPPLTTSRKRKSREHESAPDVSPPGSRARREVPAADERVKWTRK